MSLGSLEARWKCLPQRFSALAGNVGSVALVLTIKGASLLNRPCQTMQCPAESERWGHGLAVKPSGSYFLSMTTSINLSRPWSWTLPNAIPARQKSKRFRLLELNKGWIILPNMSLSRTVHLWIPHGLERKIRHKLLRLTAVDAVFSLLPPLTLMSCL